MRLPPTFVTRVTRVALPLVLGVAACTHDATSPASEDALSALRAHAAPGIGATEPVFAASAASLIWRDNFDSVKSDAAMLSNYATLQAGFMHLDRTGGIAGSGAARIDWQASTSCSDDSRVLEKDFAAPATEIYVQYSVRYTAGAAFDWTGRAPCTGNEKSLLMLWSGSGSRFDFMSENHVLGVGSDDDHPLFSQNAGLPFTDEKLADGNWHRVTLHVRQSSTPTATDGLIEGWIDGVLRWSKPNVASNASGGWTLLKMPATFNQGSPKNQSEWLDGLSVWSPNAITPPDTVVVPITPPTAGTEPSYASGGGTLLWQDNFDGRGTDAAMLSQYALMDGESGIHFDAAAGLNGSGAARIDWQAQTSASCLDDSHLIEHSFTPSQEVYVQYSVRYQPGFIFDWTGQSGGLGCVGNAKKLLFLWAASGSRFDFISENHWLGMGSDYDHPLFNQNVGPVVSDEMLGDGNWHRITMHVRQSSTPTATDGLIEGWIDGVQRWSWPNIASNASGGWVLFKMPTTFNQGSPVAQSEWFDGLTVWRP
ncbi:MAG TPA: hypothetical protein VN613_12165 [Gemmatimonadaceae bacterium]|nr:hypothetical protein [Gemmatimonadaceae bacterium]